jgi:transposase
MTKGIVTGHYMKFISKTLDEMDNAPIYTLGDITRLIEARGYRAMYLPPYSPELNPIENFWSVVKNSVKTSAFQKTEDLKTRISEASEYISRKTLHNIAQHSVENFRRCFDKESL